MSDIITVADFTSLKNKVNALRASTNIPSTNSYNLSEEAPHSQIIDNVGDSVTVTRDSIIYKSDLANLDTKIYKAAYYSGGYTGLGSGTAQGTKRHDSGDFFKTGSTLLNSDSIDTASTITAGDTKISSISPSSLGDKADLIKSEAERIKHKSHASHSSHSSSYTYYYTSYRHENHGSHGSHVNTSTQHYHYHANHDSHGSHSSTSSTPPGSYTPEVNYTTGHRNSGHSTSPHNNGYVHGSHSSHSSSFRYHYSS